MIFVANMDMEEVRDVRPIGMGSVADREISERGGGKKHEM